MVEPADSGGFVREALSAEEVERQAALYGPLADAVRALADASIRTLVEDEEVRRVTAELRGLAERLQAEQLPGSFGVRYSEGRGRPWGNAVVGLRNPVAPPLHIEHDPGTDGRASGRVRCDFHLGAAYEGPPSLVHGGVLAMILDQILGESAGAGGRPGMTGTLTVTYRQGTPLGDLRSEAWIDRVEGIKTYAKGRIVGPEGVTVEAEGVFILPRWARALLADGHAEQTPRYFE